ncbi:hypothetical protein VTO73DRAFT_10292 [Trametes versicolor]
MEPVSVHVWLSEENALFYDGCGPGTDTDIDVGQGLHEKICPRMRLKLVEPRAKTDTPIDLCWPDELPTRPLKNFHPCDRYHAINESSSTENLDPFFEHSDAVLNDALRSAGLFNLQVEGDMSRITLNTQIAGGGANLSVGQRQILALARAIVRRSKLLILDEATSAIDYETDAIIQASLRTELGKDVTLLTVAHRLQTIMDTDKIVEFGKQSALLQNEKGMLRALVDESGDREKSFVLFLLPPPRTTNYTFPIDSA